MESIKTRWLVSVMLIIDDLANLTIWIPFDNYLVRFIEGLRNIATQDTSQNAEKACF